MRWGVEPETPRHPFSVQLKLLRQRCQLSQNRLARLASVDPAYVNRLERHDAETTIAPSRSVVLQLFDAMLTAGGEGSPLINNEDRERLLVAAGLCPETIVRAGGWDGYRRRVRLALEGGEDTDSG